MNLVGNGQQLTIMLYCLLPLNCQWVVSCRRPRRLAGGKGGEGREPKEPKDPNKRMKAGLPPAAQPGAPGDR